jgi:hypothetical protein
MPSASGPVCIQHMLSDYRERPITLNAGQSLSNLQCIMPRSVPPPPVCFNALAPGNVAGRPVSYGTEKTIPIWCGGHMTRG